MLRQNKKSASKWKADFSDMPYEYMYDLYMKSRYRRQLPLQRTFDIAARHMLKQGERSWRKGYGCLYDGPDGLMSPVRVLIPDRDWVRSSMEYKSCDCGPVAAALLKNGHDLDLAKDLQSVHDYVEPKDWYRELRFLANKYELDFRVGR